MTRPFRKIIVITLLSFLGFLFTELGLGTLLTITAYFLPITFEGSSGSLWQDNISFDTLIYHDLDGDIVVEQLILTDFTYYPFTAKDINIGKIHLSHIPRIQLNTQTSSAERMVSIKQIEYTPHTLLVPILINDITISSQADNNTVSFNFRDNPVNLKRTQVSPNKHEIQLSYLEHNIDLLMLEDKKQLSFVAAPSSLLQNISGNYLKDNGILELSINHQNNDVVQLNAAISTKDMETYININSIDISSLSDHLIISGELDTLNKQYALNASYGDDYVKVKSLSDTNIIVSAGVNNLIDLTPYLDGSLEINLNYSESRTQLYAYSPTLGFSLAKLTDVQLSYDSTSDNILYISASQLRNPLLLVNQPSISIEKNNESSYNLLALGIYNDIPQTVVAKSTQDGLISTVSIEKLNISTNNKTEWKLQQNDPMLIDSESITLPKTTVTSNNGQSFSASGNYDWHNNDWLLTHHAEDLILSFNSQGVIDDDTEGLLQSGKLSGQGTTESKDGVVTNTGEYSLSEVEATILNAVPDFSFPLDYYMQDSYIKWSDGHIQGMLYSEQGDIALNSTDEGLHIFSPQLSFANKHNRFQASVDLINNDQLVSGDVHVSDLFLNFDPATSFLSFPKDITVLGEIASPKTAPSQVDYHIQLHFDNTPTSIMGLSGQGSGQLLLKVPKESYIESVTGRLDISDPMLTILNRHIKLNKLSLKYNNQPWDQGHINLQLKQKTTILSGNEPSKAEINLALSGNLSSPSFDISSNPIHLSKDQALTQILLASPLLPPGNENDRLLEIISGMKRNEGLIVVLQTINNLSFLSLDISLRRSMKQDQSLNAGFGDVELLVSKQLYERIRLSFQKPLNDEYYTFSLDFKLNPKLSLVGEYNRDEYFSANIFYSN